MINIAIVGSRTFYQYEYLCEITDGVVHSFESDEISIISGGARGADSLAERYAAERGYPLIVFNADWGLHGKSAGYKRNVQIVEAADYLIAFWQNGSPGTKHSIDLAYDRGIRTYIAKC
jgi:hypothetical protein